MAMREYFDQHRRGRIQGFRGTRGHGGYREQEGPGDPWGPYPSYFQPPQSPPRGPWPPITPGYPVRIPSKDELEQFRLPGKGPLNFFDRPPGWTPKYPTGEPDIPPGYPNSPGYQFGPGKKRRPGYQGKPTLGVKPYWK